MELERELRDLATYHWNGPVVSLYLDTRWRDEAQRERVRVFWSSARSRARADGVAEGALRRIDQTLTELIRVGDGSRARAIFAARNRFEMIRLHVPVGMFCAWDLKPTLLPLVAAQTRSVRTLAAVLGAKRSRLYELCGVEVRGHVELEQPDFPGRHHAEGFSQGKVQHHIDQHLRWELDAVARALLPMFDRAPCRVLVFATPHTAGMFRQLLPVRVLGRLRMLDALSGDPRDEERDLVRRVAQATNTEAMDAAYGLEQRVYRLAMADGAGAIGVQDTLLALQEGRVQTLVVKEGLRCYGGECLRCGAIDTRHVVACGYCGGKMVAGDLTETLVQRALRQGASVTVVPEAPRLRAMGELGAVLRPTAGLRHGGLGTDLRMPEFPVGKWS